MGEARIAIIGGGPAGLSAARLLLDAGLRNVTVFEADSRLGGKSLTAEQEGVLHEMGTCYSTLAHTITNRWMRELGIRQVRVGRQMFDGEPFINYLRAGPGAPLAIELTRFMALYGRHRLALAMQPHDRATLDECAMPIETWLERHRFVRLRRFMLRAITIMGYGRLGEVPVCQALRWTTPALIATGLTGALRMPVSGWQGFWAKLAHRLNVRLAEPVTAIDRDSTGVAVTTPAGTARFDAILVTIPLDDLSSIMAMDDEERFIQQSVSWGTYTTTLLAASNWFTAYETDAFSSAVENGVSEGALLAARRPPAQVTGNAEYYVCGQYGGGLSNQELLEELQSSLAARGARLEAIALQKRWKYGPRYHPDAIKSGLPARMAAVQGRNHTWYSGATFSHEAVSNITSFNARLARRIAAHHD